MGLVWGWGGYPICRDVPRGYPVLPPPIHGILGIFVYSTMRSLHGVGSILRSKGRAKLLIATTAWPGARLGSRFQSESSTTPNERLSRLMTLASPILWRT